LTREEVASFLDQNEGRETTQIVKRRKRR
jgi:hypothetical protein